MQNICSKDFYKSTTYNFDTKNQLWCSVIADAHDGFCGCQHPFAHLLSSIFPPGHSDRDLTINEILKRDYTEQCHSGGKEEENHGLAGGDTEDIEIKEEDFLKGEKEDLDMLLAAAAAEESTR